MPEAVTSRAAFGYAIHHALEYAQHLTRADDFALGPVLSHYETALRDQYLAPAEHERYLTHGQQVLRHLFEHHGLKLSATGRPEVTINDVRLGQARLSGALDRVDTSDGTVTITDYKTGTPLPNLFTKDKTKALKAWRHRTQLEFYILLATASHQFRPPREYSAQMLYVEAEITKDLTKTYAPSAEQLARLQTLIAVVWDKITSLNLPDVRHYDTNYQGVSAFIDDLLKGNV